MFSRRSLLSYNPVIEQIAFYVASKKLLCLGPKYRARNQFQLIRHVLPAELLGKYANDFCRLHRWPCPTGLDMGGVRLGLH